MQFAKQKRDITELASTRGSLLLHSKTKTWWLAYEKVFVKKFQRHNIFPLFHVIKNFLVRTLHCFLKKSIFLPTKKLPQKAGNNSYFFQGTWLEKLLFKGKIMMFISGCSSKRFWLFVSDISTVFALWDIQACHFSSCNV